jgi:xanthine dehydrogenase YagT iron-sulfur-binding subunit
MADYPEDNHGEGRRGITRRSFLTSMGVGALAVGASGELLSSPPELEQAVAKADETTRVNLLINGRQHTLLAEPRWTLLYVLREQIGLTGTKVGCERGECGACTVLIDNVPRYACLTLAMECEGSEIVTLEGLMKGEDLGPVQQAFLEHDGFQCGYCTPGQIMAVEGLLRKRPDPTPDDTRKGLSGNLCRCGAYPHIFQAARRAAELKSGKEVRGGNKS